MGEQAQHVRRTTREGVPESWSSHHREDECPSDYAILRMLKPAVWAHIKPVELRTHMWRE